MLGCCWGGGQGRQGRDGQGNEQQCGVENARGIKPKTELQGNVPPTASAAGGPGMLVTECLSLCSIVQEQSNPHEKDSGFEIRDGKILRDGRIETYNVADEDEVEEWGGDGEKSGL